MRDETLPEYTLSPEEVAELRKSAARLAGLDPAPCDPRFYERNWDADAGLPAGLRGFLERFRRTEPAPACLVHGFPVDDAAIGPTPEHWSRPADGGGAEAELFLAMCGTALGEPFAWPSLQLGRMIQDILPIRGDEQRQSGHSSQTVLELHTEDGFHPGRADYLLLFGMRNHERVPTTVASVRDVELDGVLVAALGQPRFHIRPDDEHLRQLRERFADHPALASAREMDEHPPEVPVLFGDRSRPYIRIDLPFMECVDDGGPAMVALVELTRELERVQREIVVEQGTLAVLDNYLAVHGRSPFRARYDGTDRWLKRMIVSRDLRKSAAGRLTAGRRLVY
jgi:Fe(II)/alpha-ketoglutarate-dependent arginine beta-hydroxylase